VGICPLSPFARDSPEGVAHRDRGQDSLTESNYHILFSMIIAVLVRPWEGLVKNMKFTEVSPRWGLPVSSSLSSHPHPPPLFFLGRVPSGLTLLFFLPFFLLKKKKL
jgi:hypothetical protein